MSKSLIASINDRIVMTIIGISPIINQQVNQPAIVQIKYTRPAFSFLGRTCAYLEFLETMQKELLLFYFSLILYE